MKPSPQLELLQLIAQTGDCEHIIHYECRSCLLSKYKRRPDGTWMSCLEAVGALNDPGGYKNAYRLAAQKILADLAIEEMVNGDELLVRDDNQTSVGIVQDEGDTD